MKMMRLGSRRRLGVGVAVRHGLASLSSAPSSSSASRSDYAALNEAMVETTVLDVMSARGLRPTNEISGSATVIEAMRLLTERRVGSALVVDEGRPTGVFTARDLLGFVSVEESHDAACSKLASCIGTLVTPAEKVAWCAPSDPLKRVRMVMRSLGVRNLPVVCTTTATVLGMLTAKDVADFALEKSAQPYVLGGKDAFLKATHGRSGLPRAAVIADAETRKSVICQLRGEQLEIDESASLVPGNIQRRQRRRNLDVKMGSCALPNPFKREDGTVATSFRDMVGIENLPTNEALSEDAFFIHEKGYVGIFDGVGSWRKAGVDPRLYPRALSKYCVEDLDSEDPQRLPKKRPQDVLLAAWRRLSKSEVAGSTTACLATLDEEHDALSYVNLGDAGIVVFRDPSRTSGTAFQGDDKAVVMVAPQQSRSFNLPYQLGWTNTDSRLNFETPFHGNVASFPVKPGDVVVLATDGLFDNVFIDDLAGIIEDWQMNNVDDDLDELASIICATARKASLDETNDSPFAKLARENDILWSGAYRKHNLSLLLNSSSLHALTPYFPAGGMPDDVTVVVMRICQASQS